MRAGQHTPRRGINTSMDPEAGKEIVVEDASMDSPEAKVNVSEKELEANLVDMVAEWDDGSDAAYEDEKQDNEGNTYTFWGFYPTKPPS